MSPLKSPRDPPNRHGCFLSQVRQRLEALRTWWGFGAFNIALATQRSKQMYLRINSVRESLFYLNFSGGIRVPEKLYLLHPDQVGTTEQGDSVPNSRSHEKSLHLAYDKLGSFVLSPLRPGTLKGDTSFSLKGPSLCQEGRQRVILRLWQGGKISSSAVYLWLYRNTVASVKYCHH